MRRDELYLNDIVEAADHIAAFLHDTDFEAFLKSELIRSAVAWPGCANGIPGSAVRPSMSAPSVILAS